jgi:hypothetical protein
MAKKKSRTLLHNRLFIITLLAIVSILGAFMYVKKSSCAFASEPHTLTQKTLCHNRPLQTPTHVCQPGLACRN